MLKPNQRLMATDGERRVQSHARGRWFDPSRAHSSLETSVSYACGLTVAFSDREHACVSISTEPIGSVPRPRQLIETMRGAAEGRVSEQELEAICEKALAQTISELEAAARG